LVDAGMKIAKFIRRTCVNTGCIPTKTLVASAYAAKIARRAADFGVRLGSELTVDIKAVKARRDAISGQSRTGVETWMKGLKSCTVYEGHGHFLSSHEIAVGDEVWRPKKFFHQCRGPRVGAAVNIFTVARDDLDSLLAVWEHDANWMKKQPGYISTQLHRGIGGSCAFLNYAVWESVEHFRRAFIHPEFRGALAAYPSSVVAMPHLFAKVAVANLRTS
jgi:heme-degrading monooxygenase HmoA